jgi:hypothetical protein
MRPIHAETTAGRQIAASDFGQLTKARILFAIPLDGPDSPRRPDVPAWLTSPAWPCYAGLGPYHITGKLHLETGRDPRVALRLITKPFLPITGATVTFPSGETRAYATIIVNRAHLDMLTFHGLP